MDKIFLVLVAIGVILFIAVAGYFIYKSNQGKTIAPSGENGLPKINISTENLTGAITIENFVFNPSVLTVKENTAVTWTNNDSAPHKIKSDSFNSATLSKGESFKFTFYAAGEYDYSCALHPSMMGKIIVTK